MIASARFRPQATELLRQFAVSFYAHRWMCALAFAYVAGCGMAAARIGALGRISLSLYGALMWGPMFVAAAAYGCYRTIRVLFRYRPLRPFKFLSDDCCRDLFTRERMLTALPVLIVLPPFLSVYTDMKCLIPVLNPYHWDSSLAALDRMLCGGIDPWRLLQPLLGHPVVSSAINFLYQVWIFVLYGVWLWQAFSVRDFRLRIQFFLTFMLLWAVLGTLIPIMCPAGGPVYYGRLVGGPDPFAPLMAYLHMADAVLPIWSLAVQDHLWAVYLAHGKSIGSGISAMASLHVATTLLFALIFRRRNRILGRIGFLYLAVVVLGSIHLGWHYAVDGYVSIAGTLLLWSATGWAIRRTYTPEVRFAGTNQAAPSRLKTGPLLARTAQTHCR